MSTNHSSRSIIAISSPKNSELNVYISKPPVPKEKNVKWDWRLALLTTLILLICLLFIIYVFALNFEPDGHNTKHYVSLINMQWFPFLCIMTMYISMSISVVCFILLLFGFYDIFIGSGLDAYAWCFGFWNSCNHHAQLNNQTSEEWQRECYLHAFAVRRLFCMMIVLGIGIVSVQQAHHNRYECAIYVDYPLTAYYLFEVISFTADIWIFGSPTHCQKNVTKRRRRNSTIKLDNVHITVN